MATNILVASNHIGRITVYSPDLQVGYVHEDKTDVPFGFSLKFVSDEA
jgi:hypothetical protein